jgi:SOS-response transcriptional repressor LexA
VKRYESEQAHGGDSWRHTKVTLKPVNQDFEPIILTGNDEHQFQVVAELVEVFADET